MRSETLKRLFRSIKREPTQDLIKIAQVILDDERKKGHDKLAHELSNILKETSATQATSERYVSKSGTLNTLSTSRLTSLPLSKRDQQPLLMEVKRENLRHEMILPNEIEQRFQRVIKEYVASDRLAHYGLKPRQKILLYGPPGCGKSMGAERLAWDIGLPFYKVRFESLLSSFLGESGSNLRKVFDVAQNTPCVLLLDECDFIAKSRNIGQDVGEMSRMVNMLLYLLEEYNAQGLLVATTNLEETLDKAIFRRFDEVLEVPKPGKGEVHDLLLTSLSSINVDKGLNFNKIVDKMDGFSAAQVVKVARDAAKACVVAGDNTIRMNHLESALSEVINRSTY
ncbi:AAA family ATPase [Pontibacter ruber]|uniref:AAA family ATPase n=1 Tax=Pontibacter ruber TaxID=1343895 RepID=A0ABW5CXL4_9BACT|nr:AAA family ATPase [Pontibacter ruber]